MKIKIEQVSIGDPKEGVNKKTQKKWKLYPVGIETNSVEGNEKGWVNGAVFSAEELEIVRGWKPSDEVNLKVYNDSEYGWKWKFLTDSDKEMEDLTDRIKKLEAKVFGETTTEQPTTDPEQVPPPAQTDPGTHIEDDLPW